MATYVRCPHCQTKNDDKNSVCEKCGKPMRAMSASEMQHLESILVVTTPGIEGRAVCAYCGVVVANVVLGTGWSTEFGASLADFSGTRATGLQQKLQAAADAALMELRAQAFQRDADAVLGVDVDYQIFGNNLLMVSANGTAVRLAD